MGAPVGNQNAANKRRWQAAIERALAKRSKTDQMEAINDLAEKLLELCDKGDLGALKELGDRLDGKPKQAIIGGDDDDAPIRIAQIERVIIDKAAD
jgi:hypothetical protein